MKFFKSSKKAEKPAADTEPAKLPPGYDPEVRGQDSRRMAELKADMAGMKWRAEAEANGEIEREVGGPKGLEPTRYGDWERAGRCVDF